MNCIARVIVGVSLLLAAGSCGGAVSQAGTAVSADIVPEAVAPSHSAPEAVAPVLTELPSLSQLDELRGASAVTNADIAVLAPVSSQHTAPAGAELAFDGNAGGVSFAIYRVATPVGTLLSATGGGSGALWLLAADYGRGYWYPAAKLAGGLAQIDLGTLLDPTSPGGFVYVAVACEPGQNGSLALLFVSYDAPPQGPTYYVAAPPLGNDANDGSQGAPWATLQYAADTVAAGDTVVVMPGDYVAFMLQTSGEPGQPISFLAQPGVNIIDVNPTNHTDGINIENWGDGGPGSVHDVVIDGFTVDGDACITRPRTGIRIVGSDTEHAHDIEISNNTCLNCGTWGILTGFVSDILIQDNECAYSIEEHGIYHSNSGDRAVIRGNILHDNAGCGQHMNGDSSLGGDGVISDCVVENNMCFRNGPGGSAINCDGVQDSIIRGNLLFDNYSSGISLYQIDAGDSASGNLVVCNTIINASTARWCVNISDGSGGNRLYNNIFYNHHGFRGAVIIDSASLTGFESDYNAVMDRFNVDDLANLTLAEWQTQTGQDMHSFVTTPAALFIDEPGADFHLNPGCPAINAGFNLGADMPALDIDGVARPTGGAFDLGALEYAP